MTNKIIFFILSLLVIANSWGEDLPSGYAIATAHPLATNAAIEMMNQGGNAFDAAIAASAALGVVAPYHSGLGGGGFWLLHLAKEKKNTVIDGREVAPLAAKKEMFLSAQGEVIKNASLNGGLAAAIPGEPAALVYIAAHYGRLPLKKSLAPAIRLAKMGFPVDEQFIAFTQMPDRLALLKSYPASANSYLNHGKPYVLGDILKQPDLARSLTLLAEKGHDGFYRGEIAEKLVKANRQAGGIWTLQDLTKYQIIEREPLLGAYHNMLVITVPPPSAGGVELLTMLNILEHVSLQSYGRALWIHYIVESMRLAYWQANQTLGDPAFVNISLDDLLSADNAKKLLTYIQPNRATSSQTLKESTYFKEGKETTHIAILDQEGNRVSATMTVNFIFGSGFVAEGTGILLNDEMDDFAVKPGVRNVFGLLGSRLNQIEPGKRPLSSMTPLFLEMPQRVAIAGTPGGSRIPTMMLLASLSFYDYGGAISMVSAMRFHHQYVPDWVQFEPETFAPELIQELKMMGYQLMALKQYYGDMQAITWDKKTQVITAASDPRHIGLAVVVKPKQREGYGFSH